MAEAPAQSMTPREQAATVCSVLVRIGIDCGLSPALVQRLCEVAEGQSYRSIASAHAISVNTVKTQVAMVLHGLDVRCRHEIEDAVTAAELRACNGADEAEIMKFLKIRFE